VEIEVLPLSEAREILIKNPMLFNIMELNGDDISFLLKQNDSTIEKTEYVQCVDSIVITRKSQNPLITPINRLKGSTVYLAGSIDLSPDSGKSWRDQITAKLHSLGVTVYNPLEKPIDIGLENDDARISRKLLKESGQFDKFREIMKTIRHADLRMIDKSDFMIVYLDLSVVFCGTMEEISWCNKTKKVVAVFCKQGKLAIPDWIWGMLPHELLFDTMDDVMTYLEHINNDPIIDDLGRWLFFH
jgi:nucleoside 2-deoxyribosyltransferase